MLSVSEREARHIIERLHFSHHAFERAAFRLGRPTVELVHFIRSNIDPHTAIWLQRGSIQFHAGTLDCCPIYLIARRAKRHWKIVTVETAGALDAMIFRELRPQRRPTLRRHPVRSRR